MFNGILNDNQMALPQKQNQQHRAIPGSAHRPTADDFTLKWGRLTADKICRPSRGDRWTVRLIMRRLKINVSKSKDKSAHLEGQFKNRKLGKEVKEGIIQRWDPGNRALSHNAKGGPAHAPPENRETRMRLGKKEGGKSVKRLTNIQSCGAP